VTNPKASRQVRFTCRRDNVYVKDGR